MTLFYETVHVINRQDYTKEQVEAWAPKVMDLKTWDASLMNSFAFIVEIGDVIVGFGDIDETGYLDRLYVHKDYQGLGIGTRLTEILENYASLNQFQKITTHASITARPFFEKRGYRVLKEQQVNCRGVWMTNFVMCYVIE